MSRMGEYAMQQEDYPTEEEFWHDHQKSREELKKLRRELENQDEPISRNSSQTESPERTA